MFLGNLLYDAVREPSSTVLVHQVAFDSRDPAYNDAGDNYAVMIRAICEFAPRTEMILGVLAHLLKDPLNGKIMVLAQNLSLLRYLFGAIQQRNEEFSGATVGYYVGGMKKGALKDTEECKVVLGTYAMAEEGLDIPALTTLVLATPRSDVTQAVGRILRLKHERPQVVDILDYHFASQASKRLSFYRQNGYTIVYSDAGKYPEISADKTKKKKLLMKLE
jgi:superfamily II DNA or RNA helicase